MKARRIKGLDPDAPLADMAERIVRVRMDELLSFVPRALDPSQGAALHDMRIAAKRLRYVLEVTAGCFGPYATAAARRARQLQDAIGEIHDCDVLLGEIAARLEQLRAQDVVDLRRRAQGADDLSSELAARAPNRAAYRGLEVLTVHVRARRELLFERFLDSWRGIEHDRVGASLDDALSQRAEAMA